MVHYFHDGTHVDFSKDKIGHVSLNNILHALALEHRFVNQAPITVLTHSIAVGTAISALYPQNYRLIQAGFCHDFGEIIFRDVPTPVKQMIGKKWYEVENELQDKLLTAMNINCFPLGDNDGEILDQIDKAVCYIEILKFFGKEFGDRFLNNVGIELPAEIIVVATEAVNYALSYDLWDNDNDDTDDDPELSGQVVSLFRQIVNLSVD